MDLWFVDECHFQQHGTRCTMWVPKEEKDPILLHAPTRKSVALFGAVRPSDGVLVTMVAEVFNAETYLAFLQRLSAYYQGSSMVVVADNARYHHAKLLQPWVQEQHLEFRLDYLPPYSPELNPIERVWKLARRRCTHNRYFPELKLLVATVLEQFAAWATPNDTLRKLCAVI